MISQYVDYKLKDILKEKELQINKDYKYIKDLEEKITENREETAAVKNRINRTIKEQKEITNAIEELGGEV